MSTKKKPQALKFNPLTEAALKILQEIDGSNYNKYVEEILDKHVEKAAKVVMDKKGIDLYALAKKKCESDTSYHKYM